MPPKRKYNTQEEYLKGEALAQINRKRARRLRVIAKLGGVCIRCGFSDWRALQVDHVNGASPIEKALLNAGQGHRSVDVYISIDNGTADLSLYQLLCANCNWIKRYENDEVNCRKYPEGRL